MLETIQVRSTTKCNAGCKNCYSAKKPGFPLPIGPRVPWGRIMHELSQLEPRIVFIEGGEPLLDRPVLTEILDNCPDDLAPRMVVFTNGSIPYSEELAGLRRIGGVSFSVDGDDEIQRSTGRNILASTVFRNMQDFAAQGIKIGIKATISPSNLSQMSWLAERARDAGASHVRFGEYICSGRAVEIFDSLSLNEPEFKTFLDQFRSIWDAANRSFELGMTLSLNRETAVSESALPFSKRSFDPLTNRFLITASGVVLPGYEFDETRDGIGNLTKESLPNILTRAAQSYLNKSSIVSSRLTVNSTGWKFGTFPF